MFPEGRSVSPPSGHALSPKLLPIRVFPPLLHVRVVPRKMKISAPSLTCLRDSLDNSVADWGRKIKISSHLCQRFQRPDPRFSGFITEHGETKNCGTSLSDVFFGFVYIKALFVWQYRGLEFQSVHLNVLLSMFTFHLVSASLISIFECFAINNENIEPLVSLRRGSGACADRPARQPVVGSGKSGSSQRSVVGRCACEFQWNSK